MYCISVNFMVEQFINIKDRQILLMFCNYLTRKSMW